MEGWDVLDYPAMHQPGTKPAISRSQVWRPNHYTTEPRHDLMTQLTTTVHCYWSPRLARSHYCQQLTLSVCLSQCLSVTPLQIASFLFFDGIEPFFGRHISMGTLQNVFFDFWFRPPNAQNLLPKICTKSPISLLVWQIDWRCLGLPGGFRGWPIQWNHAKCCGASPCCHGKEILARHGDPVAYQLVC